MDILTRIKYPKLILLVITFVLAYILFSQRSYLPFHDTLLVLGLFGTFLAGILFAYGFTAAPATAVLLILAKEQNLLLAGLIGGLGALVGDLLIFKFIRYSLADELKKLSNEKISQYINHETPRALKKYLIPVLAGFIIASPLPDEIGVSLFAAAKQISIRTFMIISYLLNTAGIFVILIIGKML